MSEYQKVLWSNIYFLRSDVLYEILFGGHVQIFARTVPRILINKEMCRFQDRPQTGFQVAFVIRVVGYF